MQKYPHIIELSSCTRKMLVFIFLFPENSLINSLISLGNIQYQNYRNKQFHFFAK